MQRSLPVILLLFVSSFCSAQLNLPCNNWLRLPSYQSYASVGDLDIPGNQITVEAIFSRTTPYSGGFQWAGDLVSKHTDPNDANYLLRPNNAEITTSNGYFSTPAICEIELNKVYHAAMVYDGVTLKFYRNGYLLSSVPATGNLYQNNVTTRIGFYEANFHNTNLIGYMNEVRVWNTARSQADIRAYMNRSLPSPTSQPGLQAYYVFDNLLNKQGNAAYNGTLGGTALINSILPTCSFTIDSCGQNTVAVDSVIINDYTPVVNYNICLNELVVEDASAFSVGDTVLLMQMKGALIDSSNTAAFGTVTDYRSAGNYEYNYVASITGNTIALRNKFLRTYEIPNGVVQLIRVPYFTSYSNTDVLTCLPWDGKKGGVLAMIVADTLRLNNNIDLTGKGFFGGQVVNSNLNSTNCAQNNYFYPTPSILAAPKGESITRLNSDKTSGKGALASAGGGGLDHNSGGGGGGNASSGGFGGFQLLQCNGSTFDNRGIGGRGLSYSNTLNKVFLAGGGGAGHCNNGFLAPSLNTNTNGGRGGGIAIISSNFIEGNNYSIIAKGDSAYEMNINTDAAHDGMGGGGAGGTILISANTYLNPFTISVTGGKGGDMRAALTGGTIGPGGGGAGGVVWLKQSNLPANITIQMNGGKSGVLLQGGNNPYGATDGSNGLSIFDLTLPFSNIPFKPNIDSVRISFNPPACNTYNFNGAGFTNTDAITNWQWFFGTSGTATTQNAIYTFTFPGPHDAKLIATDLNGCKDSVTVFVNAIPIPPIPVSTLIQPTCTMSTGTITITAPLGPDFEYSIDGVTFQDNPQFSAVAIGDYDVLARNKVDGCLSPVSTVSIVPPAGVPPVPQAVVTDQPDCITTTGTITITSPVGPTYDYSIDGLMFQAGTTFSDLQPGNYTLIVRNNLNGCTATSTVITVDPVPANPPAPVIGNIAQPNCNVSTGSITIASPLGPNLMYSLDGTNPQAATTFLAMTPGTYQVTVSNSSTGCVSAASTIVINSGPTIPSPPVAIVTEQPTCTISSGTITVTAPVGNNFEYSIDGGLFQSSVIFSNLPPSTYNVVVRDKTLRCSSQPLALIIQPDLSTSGIYFMANAFTPNGDGINDCFGIRNWGIVTELQFLIFNRWGELVFSTTNANGCWDGNFKGLPAVPGNYVYHIKANTLCGKIERKGNLALIR